MTLPRLPIDIETLAPIVNAFDGDVDNAIDWIGDGDFSDLGLETLSQTDREDLFYSLGALWSCANMLDMTSVELFCELWEPGTQCAECGAEYPDQDRERCGACGSKEIRSM